MTKVNRIGSAFSTLPFDGIDNIANVFIHDDFLGVGDATAGPVVTAVANYELDTTVGDSVASADAVAGVANHPGIVQIGTGATTPAAGDVASLSFGATDDPGADGDIVLDTNGVYVATILRVNDVDATNVEFGLVGQAPAAPNSSVLDAVSFVYEEADFGAGTWAVQINSAGTDVEEEFTLAYVQSDWVLLELAAYSTGAIFRMTTEDGVETIELTPAAMPLVALNVAWGVEAVGAAEETLDIDAFHLRYGRPAQAARQQGGIDWLGA